jgi:hypothetical protein
MVIVYLTANQGWKLAELKAWVNQMVFLLFMAFNIGANNKIWLGLDQGRLLLLFMVVTMCLVAR